MTDKELRDTFATMAMNSVMSETQEMKTASFYDWIKHLLVRHLDFSFLTVKYIEVEGVYKEAAERCYKWADEMIIQSNIQK